MYEKYQGEMAELLKGGDEPDEGGEVKDAADALSGLTTSNE